MSEGLGRYLDGIGRVPRISAEEERELGRRVQDGLAAKSLLEERAATSGRGELGRRVREGQEAARRLVEANLRLVVFMARRRHGLGVPFADLVQEGNLGLIEAAGSFKPEKGCRFSTHAGARIGYAMLAAAQRHKDSVRLSGAMARLARRVTEAEQSFEQKHHRTPRISELARICGASEEDVARVRRLASTPVSLEQPVGEDASLAEMLSDGPDAGPEPVVLDRLRSARLRQAAREILASVPDERMRRLLQLRFGLADGEARTLAELSSRLGVATESLRTIEVRALARLRNSGLSDEVRELMAEP